MASQPERHGIELHVIVYPDRDGVWIAHCLEMDVVGTGETPLAARDEVVELCEWQIDEAIKDNDIDSVMTPAPPDVCAMFFAELAEAAAPSVKLRRIDRVETRELVEA
jgi:predicted RNase H-like HicB family nuclease